MCYSRCVISEKNEKMVSSSLKTVMEEESSCPWPQYYLFLLLFQQLFVILIWILIPNGKKYANRCEAEKLWAWKIEFVTYTFFCWSTLVVLADELADKDFCFFFPLLLFYSYSLSQTFPQVIWYLIMRLPFIEVFLHPPNPMYPLPFPSFLFEYKKFCTTLSFAS